MYANQDITFNVLRNICVYLHVFVLCVCAWACACVCVCVFVQERGQTFSRKYSAIVLEPPLKCVKSRIKNIEMLFCLFDFFLSLFSWRRYDKIVLIHFLTCYVSNPICLLQLDRGNIQFTKSIKVFTELKKLTVNISDFS